MEENQDTGSVNPAKQRNNHTVYLQLIGEHYLLEIGKDAVPVDTRDGNNIRDAFYQSVKLSTL